jgi:mRNA-degrading endonuclease RelE of RelBE toxin-antitoxin system
VAFEIRWSPEARDHLRLLAAHQRALVIDSVQRDLVDRPDEPAKKRKLLRDNPLATWELRLGELRVFYDVNKQELAVEVVAVGVKEHNRLRIGGGEVEL